MCLREGLDRVLKREYPFSETDREFVRFVVSPTSVSGERNTSEEYNGVGRVESRRQLGDTMSDFTISLDNQS